MNWEIQYIVYLSLHRTIKGAVSFAFILPSWLK